MKKINPTNYFFLKISLKDHNDRLIKFKADIICEKG
jgi:hypothetical protein